MDASAGDLRRVNDILRERLFADAVRRTPDGLITGAMTEEIRKTLLDVMQYESQVAAFLLFYAEGQEGRFVLIKGDEVIGFWDTWRAALDVGRDRFGMVPLFVSEILEWEPVYRQRYV